MRRAFRAPPSRTFRRVSSEVTSWLRSRPGPSVLLGESPRPPRQKPPRSRENESRWRTGVRASRGTPPHRPQRRISRNASVDATAVAAMSFNGCRARTALSAAIIVDPVAIPSSSTMTTRPEASIGALAGSYISRLRRSVSSWTCCSTARYCSFHKPRDSGSRYDGAGLVDRPDRQLWILGCTKLANQHDIELTVERIGDDLPHRHSAARDRQHQRALASVVGQPTSEDHAQRAHDLRKT